MQLRWLILTFFISLMTIGVEGQVAVTANVVDPNGIPYANGNARAVLVDANGIDLTNVVVNVNGASIALPAQSKGLSATGAMSFTLYPNTQISYTSATSWKFSICSPPSAGGISPPQTCFSSTISISGATDISATLKAASSVLVGTLSGGLKFPDSSVQFTASMNAGTISGQANGVIPLATNTAVIGAQSHLSDNGSAVTSSESVNQLNSVPKLTPYADIRHPDYGGVCDGSTDTTAAITAAISAAEGTGGSGIVFIPDNCYTANAVFTNPNPNTLITFDIQGTWKVGSTFVKPAGSAVVCLGKGNPPQDAFAVPTCIINVSSVYGTIGTAISSTNTAVTITPTFTSGNITNLTVGSAITIAGITSCTMSSVTRTALAGTYPTQGAANATFTFGSACSIPPGALITIAGCSDTSFNGTYPSAVADFTAKTMGVRMVGSSTTVSDTSCTITGFDAHRIETARIESKAGSTITLRTNYTHLSTDQFGLVGMAGAYLDLADSVISGVTVTGNYGAGFWGDGNTALYFNGTSFSGVGAITSIPMELSTSYGIVFDKAQTNGQQFSIFCPSVAFPSCYAVGPPFDILSDMLPQSLFATNAISVGKFESSTIRHGIYMNAVGSLSNAYYTGPSFHNSVIEQPIWNAVTMDSRTTGQIYQTTVEDSLMQDNTGWSQATWEGMSDAPQVSGAPRGQITFYNNLQLSFGPPNGGPNATVNNHFCGQITVDGASIFNGLVWPSCSQATVVFNDGRNFVGEVNNDPASPSFIPHATLATNQTASTWTVNSPATISSGQKGPWGVGDTNAALITAPSGTYAQTTVLSTAFTTATGDVFLYSVMSYNTDGQAIPAMGLTTFGADTFDRTDNQACSPNITNLWWHATVCTSTVTLGSGSSHTITFYISPIQSTAGGAAYFSTPCVMQIKASENVPQIEINRWKAEMLHGYCPASLVNPAHVMAPNAYSFTGAGIYPTQIYSAGGTVIPTCNAANALLKVAVSDAPAGSLVPGTAYSAGGGTIKVWEQCAYSGSAYAWQSE